MCLGLPVPNPIEQLPCARKISNKTGSDRGVINGPPVASCMRDEPAVYIRKRSEPFPQFHHFTGRFLSHFFDPRPELFDIFEGYEISDAITGIEGDEIQLGPKPSRTNI
jgi:hypothetical protein